MIRLLSTKDAQNLRDLRLYSLKSDPLAYLSTFDYEAVASVPYYQMKIMSGYKPPVFGHFGYFDSDRLVAYVQLAPETLPKLVHRANVYELYVHPDFRRRHIASELLNHLINLAKQQPGLEQIYLHVNSLNTGAITLYRQHNFTHLATIPKAVKEANGYQDELVYFYDLTQKATLA
jgi:ribosomal protein S18 acetylase RimI-like enzyme